MKKALITGITGQDGSYLAELLLEKGYEVHGIKRRSSSFNTSRIEHILMDRHEKATRLFTHYGDLSDATSLEKIINLVDPDEIYNLAAQSNVRASFEIPISTVDIDALGTLKLLEAIKNTGRIKKVKYYQASSSEMFGNAPVFPINEQTIFNPRSPYACAKAFAHYQTINYRESYGLHASCGILFNHESPRRGKTFVTRKITLALAHILAKKQEKLFLGNIEAKRDWGYAKDYVEAMWKMLQQKEGDDFVIATGVAYSVRDLLDYSFQLFNLDWNKYVEIDPDFFRPAEVNYLEGDATKAKEKLGWKPTTDFHELIKIMLVNDLESVGLSDLTSSMSEFKDISLTKGGTDGSEYLAASAEL
jgi:GDPmannose 4,6-dehydratase